MPKERLAGGIAARGLEALLAFARRHAFALETAVVVVVLTAVYGPTLFGHVRASLDAFRFTDDVRILIPPLFRAEDPALFPRDPISDYYLAGLPDALRLLYSLAAPILGPAAFSKVLPYLMLALMLACLAVVAHRLGGGAAVLGTLALALGSGHVLARIAGGLPRAFALPLLLAGAVCLASGRPVALSAVAVLAAAFYPAVGVVLGLSLFGLLVLPLRDRGHAAGLSWRRRALVLALTALGMALVVLPTAVKLRPWGPVIDSTLVANFPEAGEHGRFDAMDRPPFPSLPEAAVAPLSAALTGDGEPLVGFLNQRSRAKGVAIALFLVAACGWIVLARRRVEARRLLVLPAALVIAHTLALVASPHLFLPERYVGYGIPALALIGVPTAFSFLRDHGRRLVRSIPLVWNVLVLALLGARGASWAGLSVLIPPEERPLYASIAELPKSSVVAGWPGLAIDNVPYLSRRTAFVTRETHMPFHARFTELMHERMRAFVWAYFASDGERLRSLHRDHGVTHLIVDRQHFGFPPPYFAPFDADTRAAFEAGRAKGFELARIIASGAGTQTGGVVLVDLSQL